MAVKKKARPVIKGKRYRTGARMKTRKPALKARAPKRLDASKNALRPTHGAEPAVITAPEPCPVHEAAINGLAEHVVALQNRCDALERRCTTVETGLLKAVAEIKDTLALHHKQIAGVAEAIRRLSAFLSKERQMREGRYPQPMGVSTDGG